MESSTDLFYQSATLMLVGMGFVFAFLSLLIVAIKIFISPLAAKFPDEKKVPVSGAHADKHTISPPIVAAISAAINQHRKSRKQP